MPRVFYEPATKAAIIKAALDARAAGKTWGEAHADAAAAGYNGSQQGIVKLLRGQGKRKGKRGRKPGRPAGSKNKVSTIKRRGRGKAKAVAAGSQTSDIAAMVDKLVRSRFNAALDQAIASLKNARA